MCVLLSSIASAGIMANSIHMAALSLFAGDEFTANGFVADDPDSGEEEDTPMILTLPYLCPQK